MFNAIPAELVLDIARKNGYMYQESIDLGLANVHLNEEYLTSVFDGITIHDDGTGNSYFSIGNIDHPAFTRLRNWLSERDYIHKETGWVNGDYVLRPFYFNGYLFETDDQFPCAAAMKGKLKMKENA